MKKERPVIILVIASAVFFIAHQYLQLILQFNFVFLDNYIDPVVLMPLLLYALVWERRYFLGDNTFVLPYSHILGYFLLMLLLGEVLLPLISDKFTADYWDVPAYALGSIAYLLARKASDLKSTSFKTS